MKHIILYEKLMSSQLHQKILWEMLKEEFYILQDKEYDNYEDIVYEGNLIGFVVATDLSTDTIQLNIFYILPQIL